MTWTLHGEITVMCYTVGYDKSVHASLFTDPFQISGRATRFWFCCVKKNGTVTPSCAETGHVVGQREKDAPQVRGCGTTLGGMAQLSPQSPPSGTRERTYNRCELGESHTGLPVPQ